MWGIIATWRMAVEGISEASHILQEKGDAGDAIETAIKAVEDKLNGVGRVLIRPSGTEPKIKLYMGIKGKSEEDADQKLEELKNAMVAIVK